MVSVELSVVAEGLKEPAHFKHTHVIDVVLKFRRPEVDPIQRALIALVVGPESAKRDPATHVLLGHSAVVCFELLENGGIVDSGDRHVVHDVGHLLEGHVVAASVVAVLDVCFDATVDMRLVVLVEKRVCRVVLVLPVFECGILAANGISMVSGLGQIPVLR